jgi:hypothetical protein
MIVHMIDPSTGEYRGARPLPIDPLETAYAGEPRYAQPGQYDVTEEPPAAGANEAARWTGSAWEVVADHRGETRWTSYTESYVVVALGEPEGTPERPEAPPLTPEQRVAGIIAERERRLGLGFAYDFGDARGVHQIGTTTADMRGWNEVTMASQAAVALGSGSAEINIVTNTGPATITALEWQQILLAATAHRQPIWAASFGLQLMDPIPLDFADDAYWP